MAWSSHISVDCSLMKDWKWCQLFSKQVKEAETAITAQFQGHVCLREKFCEKTSSFIDGIENHSFGHHYTEHRVPILACKLDDALVHYEIESDPNINSDNNNNEDDYDDDDSHQLKLNKKLLREDPKIAEKALSLVCNVCRKVVKVNIKTETCVPGNSPVFESLQPGSLQERCLYVSDMIGTHKDELEEELSESVCSCLGCCGHRTCYFPNAEKTFLEQLIKDVQGSVMERLVNEEGWSIDEPTFNFPYDFHVPKPPAPTPPTPPPPK